MYVCMYVSDYGSGYIAFGFDLSSDRCSSDLFEVIKQGKLGAEHHFKEPLANTVNLIVYAKFQNVIEVDGNHNVLFDYTNYNEYHSTDHYFEKG